MIKLEKGEKLIYEVHKHSFVFVVHTTKVFVFSVAPLFLVTVLGSIFSLNFSPKTLWFLIFLYMLWLVVMWMRYFVEWTDYYLDTWYVTDQKIYDVLQTGFFNREVSVLRYENIEDVTVRVSGLFPTLLDFGDVHIQTAGEDSSNFLLTSACSPKEVREIIVSAQSAYRDRGSS